MTIRSPSIDPDAPDFSSHRGVTKIDMPPPGLREYMLYDAHGGWMGKIWLSEQYATPESEQIILSLQAVNAPHVVDARDRMRLEA